MSHPLSILRVDSSARQEGSVSRDLADLFIDQIAETRPVHVRTRDVSTGLPVVTADWVNANFTPEAERTNAQTSTLNGSDSLIDEIDQADLLVISLPIYNFGVPASLKLWIDQIARVGKTFRYTENGPVGLLSGKRAVILVASGGTKVGSEIDFATPYLRHVMGFIGITDVEIVAADQLMMNGADKVEKTRTQVRKLAA